MGFVFQFYNLIQNLTALENVEIAAQLCPHPLDAAEVLREVGLGERMKNFPAQLSGGEQQRVAIARALIAQPDIIFADEPTGNLDNRSGSEVMEVLKNIWEDMDKSLVIITHDSRIARMAKRQFHITDGVLSEVTAG